MVCDVFLRKGALNPSIPIVEQREKHLVLERISSRKILANDPGGDIGLQEGVILRGNTLENSSGGAGRAGYDAPPLVGIIATGEGHQVAPDDAISTSRNLGQRILC